MSAAAPAMTYAAPSPVTYAAPAAPQQYTIPQQYFQQFDQNHDGVISQQEYMQFQQSPYAAPAVQYHQPAPAMTYAAPAQHQVTYAAPSYEHQPVTYAAPAPGMLSLLQKTSGDEVAVRADMRQTSGHFNCVRPADFESYTKALLNIIGWT